MVESGLWKQLRDGVVGPHWTRVENLATPGPPDLNGFWRGRSIWVELKMIRGKRIYFKHSQVAWSVKRLSAGDRDLFVVARDENRIVIMKTFDCMRLVELTDDPKKPVPCAIHAVPKVFQGGKPFDWRTIGNVLFPIL